MIGILIEYLGNPCTGNEDREVRILPIPFSPDLAYTGIREFSEKVRIASEDWNAASVLSVTMGRDSFYFTFPRTILKL